MAEDEPVEILRDALTSERRTLRRARTVLLAEQIYDSTAEDLIQDFEILTGEGVDPITLIIVSGGGDAFAGLAIMRAIKRTQKKGIKVIGQVHGQAMSMAFFILQACDERVMGKYCALMCHGLTTLTIGDVKNVEAERKIMLRLRDNFAHMLAERNTAPEGSEYREPAYWHAILEDNTPQFYDGDECLEMGLIDRVEE